ncbi:beta-aspartyl-peptidase [Sporomusa sp.]|uniref:beta-aspartyl-peptidase n=1 Tax=Sporomusa sp. TaxID=2078658 RepID=UPI002C183144|nr:beta-aspartyl-peptidase [Sporomusa sp.]HWR44725.1 beta-aspartyl-peptidase [Sporomusa sp.]
MFTILKGGTVFAPENLGVQDILIAGQVIANIAPAIKPAPEYGKTQVIDVTGRRVVPGFIDQHVHLLGGGGEGGYATRTPEVVLSDITMAGITTVVGCLGTDSITRHMAGLLAKARGLELEGISTYIYTGAYEVPPPTITGSVRSDLVLIDKVIGCGEIAISDHRSAQPAKAELARLAAESRVGGLLSGKAGVLHLHIGAGARQLTLIFDIAAETEIPVAQFVPTHINRNWNLVNEGIRLTQMGGVIDFTAAAYDESGQADSLTAAQAIKYCLEQGVSINSMTISSDGHGSLPVFDGNGGISGLQVAKMTGLHAEVKNLTASGLPLSEALRPVTINPARILKLYPEKGVLEPGSHADIVVLDQNLNIEHVFAKGKWLVQNGQAIVKGTFE